LIAAAAILGGVFWFAYTTYREPRYNGKSLTEWLRLYGPVSMQMGHGMSEEVTNAVRHIGTNAVPFLITWIDRQHEMSQWELRLYATAIGWRSGTPGKAALLAWLDPRPSRGELSVWGFVILGPSARSAIPDLVRIANRGDRPSADIAVFYLRYLGIDALPPLLSIMTHNANTTFPLRCGAIDSIGDMGYLGTNARPAIVLLIESLNEPDVATRAATALGSLHLDNDVSIPALIRCTRSTNDSLRKTGILSLGKFGRSAQAQVLPVLTKLLDDPDASIRYAATAALEQIAPEVSAP
jgi:hypothetical protein